MLLLLLSAAALRPPVARSSLALQSPTPQLRRNSFARSSKMMLSSETTAATPTTAASTPPPPAASTQFSASANLVKNIVGTGVLTLPAGVARLSDGGLSSPEALGLSALLLVAFGAMNAWGFALLGEACARTGATTYAGVWRASLGPRYAAVPAVASLFLTFTASVACLSVIADGATDLCSALTGIDYFALPRDAILVALVGAVLAPICSLRSLAPLATPSKIGVVGTVVAAAALLAVAAGGDYAPGGALADATPFPPQLLAAADAGLADAADAAATSVAARLPSAGGTAFFLSLLSNAYLAHYNAPSVYTSLGGGDGGAAGSDAPDASQLDRFYSVVGAAFAASGALFLAITAAGFSTFGVASQPMILNNYASADPLAITARVGFVLCVLFEFPLLERPFRLAIAELAGAPPAAALAPAAVAASVALITATALAGVPLDTLSAVGGGTGGALLIYVAPALVALNLDAAADADGGVDGASAARRLGLAGLAIAGVALGVLGTFEAVAPS